MALVYDLSTDIRDRQGIEKGVLEGIEKGKKKIVYKLFESKLYKEGLISLKDICGLVDLPLTTIKEMKKSFDQKNSQKKKKWN